MKATNLQDVFQEELRDILDAEEQLVAALPQMAGAAACDELRQGLETHLRDAAVHCLRLERIFEMIGAEPNAKKCDAMHGLIKEGRHAIAMKTGNAHLRDTLLICNAKKLDHYRMSAYESLAKWAGDLGLREAADLLNSSLQEAKSAEERFEALDAHEFEKIHASTSDGDAENARNAAAAEADFSVPLM